MPRATEINVQAIVDAHLFGTPSVRPTDSATAPQTYATGTRRGCYANNDPQPWQRHRRHQRGQREIVRVGAPVEGGARLHAVYHDRWCLERNGALDRAPAKELQHGHAGDVHRCQPAPGSGPAEASPTQRLQGIANNNTLFNGLARVQAVMAQGKLVGYRLFTNGANSQQAFAKLGLISGDLLTAINGTPLDDPNKSSEILQTLASAASASVTISRNGTPTEVNLNLESVAAAAEAAVAADEAAAANRNANGPGGQFGPGADQEAGQAASLRPVAAVRREDAPRAALAVPEAATAVDEYP